MTMRLANYAFFVALMATTYFGLQFLWGLLFLYWVIPNFYSGHAFLLSDISKDDDPLLFWLAQGAWVVLGVLMILADLYPKLLGA